MKYYYDVKAFQTKFGFSLPTTYTKIPEDLHKFRALFFDEEFTEYVEAHKQGDLATVIDSLIDLVYIACGTALMHGISADEIDDGVSILECDTEDRTIKLLDSYSFYVSTVAFEEEIRQYRDSYAIDSELGVISSIREIIKLCFTYAKWLGFSIENWNRLWDDVQRANMSKIRAQKTDNSKRDVTWDVIKPVGWIPPRTEELVELMKSEQRSRSTKNNCITKNRIGRVMISSDVLKTCTADVITAIYSKLVPIRVEHLFSDNVFDIVAFSPEFEIKQVGELIPTYKCLIDSTNSTVSFHKEGTK